MGQSSASSGRMEARKEVSVVVQLRGEKRRPEMTLTMDVSPHGARVQSRRSWERGEPVAVQSLSGDLFSRARVAYCLQSQRDTYVIGLQLIQPGGQWLVNPPPKGLAKPERKK